MSNHQISLQKAIDMTTLYRTQRNNILKPAYQGQDLLALSETFSRDAFESLLMAEGCDSIRIYYGMDEDLNIHAIAVAVNADNEDILPANVIPGAADAPTIPPIIEEGLKCPPQCGKVSPLNP